MCNVTMHMHAANSNVQAYTNWMAALHISSPHTPESTPLPNTGHFIYNTTSLVPKLSPRANERPHPRVLETARPCFSLTWNPENTCSENRTKCMGETSPSRVARGIRKNAKNHQRVILGMLAIQFEISF